MKRISGAVTGTGRLLLGAVLLTMTGCRGGCGREAPIATARGALTAFPGETRIVLSADFRRIRGSPLWQRLAALPAEDPEDRRIIEGFTARTGLDPFRDIHRLVAAFPEDARREGAFGLLFEGERFDDKRLVTYARDEAKLRGQDIEQRLRGKLTLWSASGKGDAPAPSAGGAVTGSVTGSVTGFFLGRRQFVLAGGGWGERMADLASGAVSAETSAAANRSLVALAERVGAQRAVWMAAVVPEATRARLQADPRFGVQASVMRLGAGLDLAPDLRGVLVAELNNATDARALAVKADEFLRAARKSPRALLLGAGPYLDGIKVAAEGAEVIVRVELDQAQTAELASRLEALAGKRGK